MPIECTPALYVGAREDRRLCFDLQEGSSHDSRDREEIMSRLSQAIRKNLPENFRSGHGWAQGYGNYTARWDVVGHPEWSLMVMYTHHNLAKRTNYHPRVYKVGQSPPDLKGDVVFIGFYFDERKIRTAP